VRAVEQWDGGAAVQGAGVRKGGRWVCVLCVCVCLCLFVSLLILFVRLFVRVCVCVFGRL
jgi:hypothetical protein